VLFSVIFFNLHTINKTLTILRHTGKNARLVEINISFLTSYLIMSSFLMYYQIKIYLASYSRACIYSLGVKLNEYW
jgi:hypothetical protein